MDKLLKTMLLYSQLLGIKENKEIDALKAITEKELKHHFEEASGDTLRGLLSCNRSLEDKISILDGFLELHRRLGLDEEKIKDRIKGEYEDELRRTDYLKGLEGQMIDYGKHFLKRGAIEEDYIKDLWRNKIQKLMLKRITHELGNNYYRYFAGKQGEITKMPLETFLEKVKKDTLREFEKLSQGLNKLGQKAWFSQEDTASIWEKVMKDMDIKGEHDKEGNIKYTYQESCNYRCCIPSFKMLYKIESEIDNNIFKEIQNANNDLEAILKISEKQGVSINTKLEGKYTTLKEKKRIVERLLEAKKAEVIIVTDLEYHDNRDSQKYIMGLNKNKITFVSDSKIGYHRDIASKYKVYDGILGGGYITIGIKEPKEKLKDIAINGTSIDYGKEPREITLKLLQKVMPWCSINVED